MGTRSIRKQRKILGLVNTKQREFFFVSLQNEDVKQKNAKQNKK